MPSHETAQLSEDDMGAIIAYCLQVKAVDSVLPKTSPGFVARLLCYFDQMPLLPAEKIDHTAPLKKQVDENSPLAFGQYLSVSCQSCHGQNLQGGKPMAPGMPPVPGITKSSESGKWTSEQFRKLLTTGKRPDGKQLDNDIMPWKMTAHFNEKEIEAIYQYLKSLK